MPLIACSPRPTGQQATRWKPPSDPQHPFRRTRGTRIGYARAATSWIHDRRPCRARKNKKNFLESWIRNQIEKLVRITDDASKKGASPTVSRTRSLSSMPTDGAGLPNPTLKIWSTTTKPRKRRRTGRQRRGRPSRWHFQAPRATGSGALHGKRWR